MKIQEYISNVDKRYQRGNATEHTFRGDLQQLLESLIPEIRATNEPKRQKCGAPDYILTKKDIPVGFIEAKDIGDQDLQGKKKTGNKEQFDRYKASLNNLIFTDYINFHLYREGEFITKVAIAEIAPSPSGRAGEGCIKPLPENFGRFENLIKDFCTHLGQTIKSSKKLAEMMAGKARLLSDIIEKSLTSDEENQENSTLRDQLSAFKEILIHDITPQSFADVYAQTIAYGMFAARYHDPTLETFSRQKAAELIPKSNPFLRKLFGYIAGPDIDDRIKWVVENLSEIFLACNVKEILKNYGKATKMEDPIIHFYETFLSEYDPKLRKSRGVWYTPQPVVDFIVRAVDDILKTEFDLPQGLADTSKTKIKVKTDIADKKFKDGYRTVEQEVHKVQILDPATGTGTFLAEVVKHIHRKFQGQQGIWSNYVEKHLLPRLNGFELLMASYAMAHLKLDLLLTETGYEPTSNQRFGVYLTNSLEESHPDAGTLFANWLSAEANEANHIKRDTPVMCVIGNPPYAVSSTNKGEWISNLIDDYKRGLNERNIQPLSDDYIKFIRYGQHFIEKNGSGVLAYISNNSFLDGLIHRQMRKKLLEAFDKIYILDLHGNTKKKETAPDGGVDQNIFDIQQGVSINIFVRTGKKSKGELGRVFHKDLYGKRATKNDELEESNLASLEWTEISPQAPYYFFVPKEFEQIINYNKGFKVNELFINYNTGIETGRDKLFVNFEKGELSQKMEYVFDNFEDYTVRKDYKITNNSNFKLLDNLRGVKFNKNDIFPVLYRVFDIRYNYYNTALQRRPSFDVMRHLMADNLALITCRQQSTFDFQHIFVSKLMVERCAVSLQTKETGYVFPLYQYSTNSAQSGIDTKQKLDEQQLLELRQEELMVFTEKAEEAFRSVKKMYESVSNPNDELTKLYEVQKSNIQSLRSQLTDIQEQAKKGNRKVVSGQLFISDERKPNLNKTIIQKIADDLGLRFTNEKETTEGTFAPIDILDYIYAVLHSPTYREKYKEFLKIDFPRVPYPKTLQEFRTLGELGSELRQIHLLESPKVEQYITQYPVDGDNVVGKPRYVPIPKNEETGVLQGNVYINDTQYFANVPLTAWKFYIGGYQPAQKWLKDRKNRKLAFDDILHYQKIIVALTETDRLMKAIDKIEIG